MNATDPILFLDDREPRIVEFLAVCPDAVVAMTAMHAMHLLARRRKWFAVFLDHDLNCCVSVPEPDRNNGWRVAKYLRAVRPEVSRVIVHSTNEGPARKMRSLLSIDYPAAWLPFDQPSKLWRQAADPDQALASLDFDFPRIDAA